MHKHLVRAALLLGITFFISCQTNPDKQKLTRAEMNRVDTLFNQMEDSLTKDLDSLCLEQYQRLFDDAVDSIRAVRLKEIR